MRYSLLITALAVCPIAFGQSLATYSTFEGPIGQYTISLGGGPSAAYGPDIVYSNTTIPLGYYFPRADYGDDLKLTHAGLVNGFQFAYFDPTGGTALSSVFVWFNNLYDGSYITGYTVSGLPGDGAWIISVDLSGGFEFNSPDWILMSIGFYSSNSPEAGWLLYDPPSIGSSQDLFYIWAPYTPGWYWFGGPPAVANFYAEIAMIPEPGTIAALGVGLVGLLGLRRRK